jgi:hypothetical protein
VKNWRNVLVLNIGLLLLFGSFLAYGIRLSQTFIPAGSTQQQVEQLTQLYGLDRPFVQRYALFLLLFLPGITLLGIYGTIGVRRPDNPHGIIAKAIMGLVLFTSLITALSYLPIIPAVDLFSLAFWFYTAIAVLGLVNFTFCLVVWNGYRWGVWSLMASAFLLFILKFAGSVPIIPSLFEFSAVIILYIFIRPYWNELD